MSPSHKHDAVLDAAVRSELLGFLRQAIVLSAKHSGGHPAEERVQPYAQAIAQMASGPLADLSLRAPSLLAGYELEFVAQGPVGEPPRKPVAEGTRRAARDSAWAFMLIGHLEQAPGPLLQAVERALEAFVTPEDRIPAWQLSLELHFQLLPLAPAFPLDARHAAELLLTRFVTSTAQVPAAFLEPTDKKLAEAARVVRQLQGQPRQKTLRIARWDAEGRRVKAGGRGGANVSAWTAAARFARTLGASPAMKARRSDAKRDWSKVIRRDPGS
jgi:hypothetical protein